MDWYPWDYKAFRTATRHLSALQRGLYRDLIDEIMDTREPLPNHEVALSNICRVDLETWKNNSAPILALPPWRIDGAVIHHLYCEEILEDQEKFIKKRSKRGKKAASKRWKHKIKLKMQNTCKPDADGMLGDATGHRQVQDISKNPPTPRRPSVFEIDPHFSPVWNSYPGRGKDGAKGEAFKGRKAIALETFREIYIEQKEENRGNFVEGVVAGCIRYAGFLDATGHPGQSCANWLRARGWEDDYSASPAQPRRGAGSSIADSARIALADKTGDLEGSRERLARLGINPAARDEG